jgi:hypothetical protein
VEITAIPNEGYRFSHWTGTGINKNNRDYPSVTLIPYNDIEVTAHFVAIESPELISFWFFGNDLPNDTPLESILPVFSRVDNAELQYTSSLQGYPFDSDHQFWRTASMERRNAPTIINYYPGANSNIAYEDAEMRGLQIRQPLADNDNENTLIFHLPTTGHNGIEFRFAAMDEGAANRLVIDYSVAAGEPRWINARLENPARRIYGTYQLYVLNFSSLMEVNDNPDFKIRIRFDASDMTANEGNRVTFNNFSLHGNIPGKIFTAEHGIKIYPNPARGFFRVDFENDIVEVTSLSLVSSSGMTVFEQTLYPEDNRAVLINTMSFNPGLYIVIVRVGEQLVSRRVVIF